MLFIVAVLIAVAALREYSGYRKEKLIHAILKQDTRFNNLVVEQMKPGWYRITGVLASSNDLAELKQAFSTNGLL